MDNNVCAKKTVLSAARLPSPISLSRFTHLQLLFFNGKLWLTFSFDLFELFFSSTSLTGHPYLIAIPHLCSAEGSTYYQQILIPRIDLPFLLLSGFCHVGLRSGQQWLGYSSSTAPPGSLLITLTCVRQLQSLVGLGFNVGHDSAGDLQTLIQSAMGGIRKEVDMHMDFMGTETCGTQKLIINYSARWFDFGNASAVTLHENQTFYVGDTEPESDHVYYQWNKMKKPSWLVG